LALTARKDLLIPRRERKGDGFIFGSAPIGKFSDGIRFNLGKKKIYKIKSKISRK